MDNKDEAKNADDKLLLSRTYFVLTAGEVTGDLRTLSAGAKLFCLCFLNGSERGESVREMQTGRVISSRASASVRKQLKADRAML